MFTHQHIPFAPCTVLTGLAQLRPRPSLLSSLRPAGKTTGQRRPNRLPTRDPVCQLLLPIWVINKSTKPQPLEERLGSLYMNPMTRDLERRRLGERDWMFPLGWLCLNFNMLFFLSKHQQQLPAPLSLHPRYLTGG